VGSRFIQIAGFVCVLVLAPALRGQDAVSVPMDDLKKAADQRTAEWSALTQALASKLAVLLPCDARARGAIEEVSRASGARLAAMMRYLDAQAASVRHEADAADLLTAEYQKEVAETPQEAQDIGQEEAAVEGLLSSLDQSVKQRPDLKPAQQALRDIRAAYQAKAAAAQQRGLSVAAVAILFKQVAEAYKARSEAVEQERQTLRGETDRWATYYAARLSRAQTECDVTRGIVPRRGN